MNKPLKDFLTTIGIMTICFSLSLVTDQVSRTDMPTPQPFALHAFLLSQPTPR